MKWIELRIQQESVICIEIYYKVNREDGLLSLDVKLNGAVVVSQLGGAEFCGTTDYYVVNVPIEFVGSDFSAEF